MTLTQFRYVLEIAKTGSVNQAASNLFTAQSVLSNSLKTLEAELGEKIFYRTTKGMSPTPFGQNFIAFITPIQLHMEQLDTILQRGRGTQKTRLSIATTGFYQINLFLAELLERYAASQMFIELLETSLEEAMSMISEELVDLAFIRRWSCYTGLTNKRLRSLRLDYFPIRSFPLGVAVGAGNPLYHTGQERVSADALREFPCVIYNYIESGPYRDIYDKLGLSISSRIVTNSRAAMYELLDETPAYFLNAPIPDIPVKSASHHVGRRTLLLENCDIETEYGWIARRGHQRSAIEEECIEMVTQWLRG